MLKTKYPFDPLLKHHFLIAIALAVWIFLFLTLTEPLDTEVFEGIEKLKYLPFYGLAGGITYLLILPLQYFLYRFYKLKWSLLTEVLFLIGIVIFGFLLSRGVYRYIVMAGAHNPYTIGYFAKSIYLPALTTILPILAIGRWAFGRYFEKKIEDQKIEIEGEGTYEGLRLQLNELVAVKADDNYVEVTYLDYGKLKKHLIRNKLSKVESMVPELLRTHRSYLINPYHFQKFKMEGGKLHIILGTEITVPVSKTYSDSVKNSFTS